MKKIYYGLFSFSALLLGASPVFASVEKPVAGSEGTVLFQADDGNGGGEILPPGGGDGEDNESGVVDPGGSDGNKGDGNNAFNISWVSNFRFNSTNPDGSYAPIKLDGNGMTLWAKGTKLTLDMLNEDKELTGEKRVYDNIPNFVQVTDNRGTANGWNLTVSQSEFSGKDSNGDVQTLKGAVVTLDHQSVTGPKDVQAPVFEDSAGVEIGSKDVVLMSAAKNSGTGNWSLNFGETDADGQLVDKTGVKLAIPGSAAPKANVLYKSAIVWTLTDGPSK